MNRKEFFLVVRSTIASSTKHDVTLMAAGLTYYIFLSLFPLTLLGLTLLTSLLGRESAEKVLSDLISQMIPGATDFLQSIIAGASANPNGYYLIGIAVLAYSASAAFSTLYRAINRAWNTEKVPGFIIGKIIGFLMMFVFGALFVLLFITSTVISFVQSVSNSVIGKPPGDSIFWNLLDVGASLAIVFLIFVMMYWFLPRVDVQFRDVWLASLLAAIAWVVVKKGFAIYLGSSFADFDALYGTLGAVVAVLFWLYASSLIILYGAELGSETHNIRTRHAKVAAQLSTGTEAAPEKSPERGGPWFSI